jgi:hypothetical protein
MHVVVHRLCADVRHAATKHPQVIEAIFRELMPKGRQNEEELEQKEDDE